MSQTDAQLLLEALSSKIPAAQAVVVTDRYGQEQAENLLHEELWMLPSLTAASNNFADQLAQMTERGNEEYISYYLGDNCYSVFEIGDKWIVGILTSNEVDQMELPRLVFEAASTAA
ncbi:MAG: hypothetical protein A2286_10355 [Gammaproteobacteria bacterium RIFOXYA12_FULL_61_12]|nr:MAG: hypothetical protein A2514_08370 [Gammaproteobacteria bacterium RIFOXYD12_FULL_61_37]OGT94412.1 MAG: hypothetical protein A2286_10355 [Gammaproteobacteria bacterium RIFOXYA12_FULL_61_12]